MHSTIGEAVEEVEFLTLYLSYCTICTILILPCMVQMLPNEMS